MVFYKRYFWWYCLFPTIQITLYLKDNKIVWSRFLYDRLLKYLLKDLLKDGKQNSLEVVDGLRSRVAHDPDRQTQRFELKTNSITCALKYLTFFVQIWFNLMDLLWFVVLYILEENLYTSYKLFTISSLLSIAEGHEFRFNPKGNILIYLIIYNATTRLECWAKTIGGRYTSYERWLIRITYQVMVVMRLGWIFGSELKLLRQDGQQGCQVGDDVFLQGWETPHDALHHVLVLGRSRQLESPEEALQQRLGERGKVGGGDQGRTLTTTGNTHDQDLE